MGLAYVMRKTNNILFPALFHFINNSLSFLSSLSASSQETQAAAEMMTEPSFIVLSVGSYLIVGCLAPVLLFAGSYLLRKASGCLPKYSDTRLVLTIVGVLSLSVFMASAGFTIMVLNMDSLTEMKEFQQYLCLYL